MYIKEHQKNNQVVRMAGTFVRNTDEIVQSLLNEEVVLITDSYIVFDGLLDTEYPFLNSTFYLIKNFDKSMYGAKKTINWMQNSPKFRELVNEMKEHLMIESVRFQYVKNNQTLSLPDELSDKAAESITKTGLEVAKHNQSNDMWLFLHEETQTAWIGIKVSNYGDFHTDERKGVLRPQIAFLMNHLASSQGIEKVLDPFAGSGEILSIREKYFEGKEFVSIDIDNKPNSVTKKHTTLKADFFETSYEDYFDAIVTDPPWGKRDNELDIDNFYKQMMNQFHAVLKREGTVVLLISQESSSIMESHLADLFKVAERFEFKVWGMPAYLYKMSKLPA